MAQVVDLLLARLKLQLKTKYNQKTKNTVGKSDS
jgi:hypothetical protein